MNALEEHRTHFNNTQQRPRLLSMSSGGWRPASDLSLFLEESLTEALALKVKNKKGNVFFFFFLNILIWFCMFFYSFVVSFVDRIRSHDVLWMFAWALRVVSTVSWLVDNH